MQYEVEKKVTGDWIDLREASRDIYSLLDYLKIPIPEISRQAESIKSSVEEDLIEYKRASLLPIFLALENMKYQSLNTEEMFRQEKNSESLLLVIMVQRLLCMGVIQPSALRQRAEQKLVSEDVNTIIAIIRKRLEQNPSEKSNPAVKKILLQVSLYQKEHEKLKELFPKIKLDKMASYLSNFVQTFDTIFDSIRKNYSELLVEEAKKNRRIEDLPLLVSLPIKKMAAFYEKQAKEISRIRSTLAFARAERYRTREPLVALYNDKKRILDTIESEARFYREICEEHPVLKQENCTKRLSREMRDEIVIILNRIIKSGS